MKNYQWPDNSPFFRDTRRLFLVDAAGAALTAVMLGFVLARFEPYFGMPVPVLYVLAAVAGAFVVYSACCYGFLKGDRRPYLRIIALANLVYCCMTVGLVLYYYSRLTALGVLYFSLELLVIACLVYVELSVVKEG